MPALSSWRKNLWRWRQRDSEMLAQAEAQKVAAERQLYRRHRIMRAVVEMREEDNFANRLREIYRETDEGAS